MANRIGVYVCHCGTNIYPRVDSPGVARFAAGLHNVVVARDYKFMCSDPGQQMIIRDIHELGLNRVVVASCSPRLHEKTFQNACLRAGLNPFLFQMTCIREHCSWVTTDSEEATAKAKHLVAAAVHRVNEHTELYSRVEKVHPDVLVVGAGIAGIQAALDVAKSGHRVHLVERAPSIGGHMAQFDKTFPTLDCAACISTPKMVAVAQEPNINLMTYSEVAEVKGFVGNYQATIRRKPRYVNIDACTGCGLCMEKCPTKVPSEFEEGLGLRKAIYRNSPQSVPNKPVIDAEHCRYLNGKKCQVCAKNCPSEAIDFTQTEQMLSVDIGTIILATGFDTFDPAPLGQYGYGLFDNVLTGLQFERLNNAVGPTGGKIQMKDGRPPESVAIIHCVGSRDVNHYAYCSRVCCMYALKYDHLLKDKLGHHVQAYNFYIDMRCFGKGYEEFYRRVQEEGVHFIRGRPAEVTDVALSPEEKGKLVVVSEDTLLGRTVRVPVDMVVLCTAMTSRHDAAEVARIFGIAQGADRFFLEEHPKLGPVSTTTDGIFLAGTCQGPKDIPDAVSHASGAAAQALALTTRGEVAISPTVSNINPDICIGCKVCIDLCAYSAIEFDERRRVSVVNEAMCKGCGSCAGHCPSGAAQIRHFTERQIFNELEGILAPQPRPAAAKERSVSELESAKLRVIPMAAAVDAPVQTS
ncbi:CoB--CoM heterodisulfide reductase iron-sulfur subunit A family protein [Desulfocurvibacter africanus]|uniref:Fumarate reductase/succinate dehydrogenase flavoprotein domain protein n=1 Tax=Desulfocurvibacter africanus subsp. africanus str. Walvis Bay TaxID=690850 RepID=F3Z2F7_DESAF|nr:CoB--CoM heterodisulfide reductase iron-sulfur subunit A family protein [Desulfocurvibacter africanus]EGJ50197.1 fumarate reductase/succinate dehydrogenase flavoprotein domain protein [Desulfocurvibacter africanus subsp. africanus str. Walvis Bay]